MGSQLNQEPSFGFFSKISSSFICVILLTDRQTNSHEFNISVAEVITWMKEVLLHLDGYLDGEL